MSRRPATLALVLAVLVALVASLLRWGAGAGISMEDYAHYLLHARALADGRPYTDIGYLYTPFRPYLGPPAMPPGLPLLLAGLFAAGLDNPVAIQLLMLVVTLAFVAVVTRYFVRRDGPVVGACVGGLLVLGPEIVAFSTHVQTDLLFCLVAWMAITAFDRPGPWSWRRVGAISFLGLAAMSVRLAGIALVPAAVLFWMIRRRELGDRVVIPGVLWIAGLGAGAVFTGRAISVVQDLGWLHLDSLEYQIANLHTYTLAVFQAFGYPFPWDRVNDGYHVFLGGVALCGLIAWLREGGWRTFAFSFAVAYAALLVVLPFGELRYLWPMFPVVLYALVRGVLLLVSLAGRRRPVRRPEWVMAGAVLVMIVAGMVTLVREQPRGSFVENADARAMFAQLRALAAQNASMRVAFARPRVLTLETGIPAMPTFGDWVSNLRGEIARHCLTHVVIGSLGVSDRIDSIVQGLVRQHPAEFSQVYSNPSFVVYRVSGLPCRPEASIFESPAGPEVARLRPRSGAFT